MADSLAQKAFAANAAVKAASRWRAKASKDFKVGTTRIHVVENEQEKIKEERMILQSVRNGLTTPDAEAVCIMGSAEHIKYLKARLKEMHLERERREQEALQLQEDLERAQSEREEMETEKNRHVEEKKREILKFGAVEIEEMEEDEQETSLRTFFSKPRLQQYFKDGKLVRSFREGKANWDELFFDLIFVAVFAVIGHHFAYNASGRGFEQYFITFAAVWKTWAETHLIMNQFSPNDFYFKSFLYLLMLTLVGMGVMAEGAFGVTANGFAVFVALSRFLFALLFFTYCFFLPEIQKWLVTLVVQNLLGGTLYALVCVGDGDFDVIQAILWVAVSYDILGVLAIRMGFRAWVKTDIRPALRLEHHVERNGLMTIIALGETIVAVLYVASSSTPDRAFAMAALGLLTAFSIQYIYFDADASQVYTHALRKSTHTALIWNYAHFFLHGAAISGGAALGFLVDAEETYGGNGGLNRRAAAEEGGAGTEPNYTPVRTVYCVSIAVVFATLLVMAWSHESQDKAFGQKRARIIRLGGRFITGLVCGLLALVDPEDLSNFGLVMVVSIICNAQTLVELGGAFARSCCEKHCKTNHVDPSNTLSDVASLDPTVKTTDSQACIEPEL
eukprot:Clim_evm101s149 gene=Clim_evmTU101s149